MNDEIKYAGFVYYPPLAEGSLYFDFEADFVEENVRCIPMIARFKLDACGIKLSLKEWSRMSVEERNIVAEYDCSSVENLVDYKKYLQQIILQRTGSKATELEVDADPQWAETIAVPVIVMDRCREFNFKITLLQWQDLNYLQRFVLVKLSKPGHENRNFPIAMKEFGISKA